MDTTRAKSSKSTGFRRSSDKSSSQSRRRLRKQRPVASTVRLGSSSFDWAKFTNFKSRYTRSDLERLFDSIRDTSKRKELLERPDAVGLYPIHWAAINNRPDLIECLFARGSSLTKRCRNSLFADGTPLHLAAMNSSLEAAAALLSKSLEMIRNGTRPKRVAASQLDPQNPTEEKDKQQSASDKQVTRRDDANQNQNQETQPSRLNEILDARDAEGQTPLMRSAAPRSRRLNTVRELLQKNFWSLSGRPAEMALFLICMGADWRLFEPMSGMNLMHLAIMNDHDDIVSLLLVIDRNLIDVATAPTANKPAAAAGSSSSNAASSSPSSEPTKSGREGFETVQLKSHEDTTRATDSESTSSGTTPLLPNAARDNADDLLLRGLKPLQLAILYSRVKMIGLLWRPSAPLRDSGGFTKQVRQDEIGEVEDASSGSRKELKKLLCRACFSDRSETFKFMRPLLLKGLLVLDLALLAMVWAPIYIYCSSSYLNQDMSMSMSDDEYRRRNIDYYQNPQAPQERLHYQSQSVLPALQGGLFFLSYCATLILTLRVVLKNPGFLRRHSVHYLSELAKLLDGSPRARDAIAGRLGRTNTTAHDDDDDDDGNAAKVKEARSANDANNSSRERRRPSSAPPLIKLDDTTSIVVRPKRSETSPPPRQPETANDRKRVKTTTLAMDDLNRLNNLESPLIDQRTVEQRIRRLEHGARQLCHRCQCIRRPRSRHCNSCDHCVQDFDHHCIYLGCCIGRNNRLDFLLAMMMVTITAAYGTALQSISMRHVQWSRVWHTLAFIWVFKYVLIGGVNSFLNLRRACLGVTMYEEVRSKRLREMFGRRGPPAEISRRHAALSTLKGAFWRYLPFDLNQSPGNNVNDNNNNNNNKADFTGRTYGQNLREFANYVAPDEYLLTFFCADTPLARSLLTRLNEHKIKQQQMLEPD